MASSITYPFSLAKSRAQVSSKIQDDNDGELKDTIEKASDGTTAGPPRARKAARRTVFSTILHIARKDGIGALYEGLDGEVLKGFFSHGITMIVKQAVHKVIIQLYFMILKMLKQFPEPADVMGATKEQADNAVVVVRTVMVEIQEGGQRMVQQGSFKAYDAARDSMAAAKDTGSSVQEGVKDTASKVGIRAGELYGTARRTGTSTAEKASDMVSATYRKGQEVGGKAAGSITEASKPVAEIIGRKMENTGKAIRPSDGDSN